MPRNGKGSPRLLHVSCIVRDEGRVWELLRALEVCGVGNVEVKPIGDDIPPHVAAAMGLTVHAPPVKPLPAPAPDTLALPKPRRKRVESDITKKKILASMQHLVPIKASALITKTGLSKTTVYFALHIMHKRGWVTRQKLGTYVKTANGTVS